MQTVQVGRTDRTTTQLGFGCSSLMGGLNSAESLALLESAFDAGIRHFDVAPMYGFGKAESCLGEFLARHRGQVTVTTKYGIPPAKRPGIIRFARSLARPLIRVVPALKRGLTSAAAKASGGAAKASFTAQEASESLERSLRELKTDHVDIWLLHDAIASDLHDERLLRLMQDSIVSGKIGTFGVGSERAAIEDIAARQPEYLPVMQFAWSVLDPAVGATQSFRIHHRALSERSRLRTELHASDGRVNQWCDAIGVDIADPEILSSLMLKAALIENARGIVLFSSKRPDHIRRNVAIAGDAKLDAPALRLHDLLQAEKSAGAGWNAGVAG